MKLVSKAFAGLAAAGLIAGGVLAASPAHAFIVKDGWTPIWPDGSTVNALGAQITNIQSVYAAGCEEGSSYTMVVRQFNDPDGDGLNNDTEPKGTPGGLIPAVPGNPVAPWWHANTDVVTDKATLTNGAGMWTGNAGDIGELQRLANPAMPMGNHRYAIGFLCVTDTGDPDFYTKEFKLDAQGHPIGQWFVADMNVVDRMTTSANKFVWVNNVPAFAADPVVSSSAPVSSAPVSSAPVSSAPAATVTVTVPGPTTTVAGPTVTVPGPTTTVNNTVTVAGPTVVNTVTVPGPTTTVTAAAVTVNNTVTVAGPTVSVPGPTTTVNNTVTVAGPATTVTVPGPATTVTTTAAAVTVNKTVTVAGPTTTVSVPGPATTVTKTVATTVAGPATTVTVPGPATTVTKTVATTVNNTVTVSAGTVTKTVAGPTTTINNTVTKTVTVGSGTGAPTATVTVYPNPFAAKCHVIGIKPWWCIFEPVYVALINGWLN